MCEESGLSGLTSIEDRLMQTAHQRVYAVKVNEYRAKYMGARVYTLHELNHARYDILKTIPLHDFESAYSGKLWAELDAIREALQARW